MVANYNLNDVREAVKKGRIEYRGRKVRRDINNLGYELQDILACLLSLTESDFYKSYTYENGDIDDAYCTHFLNPQPDRHEADSVYIKFCLMNQRLMIDLASFHLTG